MTVFSFTAPQVTEDDEQNERDSLTEQEREQLYLDLYGPSPIQETDEQRATAQERFDAAIENLPDSCKKIYLKAMEVAPEVVKEECPALVFLRCEDHDENAAARRLMEYWDIRFKFFGEEKAFLPMTLSGAMRDDEDNLLRGFIHLLPSDDSNGRPVVYWDRIRLCEPYATRNQAYRVAFYTSHHICMDEKVQMNGCVLMMNFEGFDIYKHMDRIRTKLFSQFFTSAMPMKVRSHHMFCGRSSAVLELALPVLKILYGKYLRLRMVIHDQKTDFYASAREYGIQPEGLNQCRLCGEFNRNIYLQWLSQVEGRVVVDGLAEA